MHDRKNMELLHLIDTIVNRLQSGAGTARSFPFEISIFKFADDTRYKYTLTTLFKNIVFVFESPTQCKIKSFDYIVRNTKTIVNVIVTEAVQNKHPITITHAQQVTIENGFPGQPTRLDDSMKESLMRTGEFYDTVIIVENKDMELKIKPLNADPRYDTVYTLTLKHPAQIWSEFLHQLETESDTSPT